MGKGSHPPPTGAPSDTERQRAALESLRGEVGQRLRKLEQALAAQGAIVEALKERLSDAERDAQRLEENYQASQVKLADVLGRIDANLQHLRDAPRALPSQPPPSDPVAPPPTAEQGLPSQRAGWLSQLADTAVEHYRWTTVVLVLVVALLTGQPAAVVDALLGALLPLLGG
jgi:hypothetical protein